MVNLGVLTLVTCVTLSAAVPLWSQDDNDASITQCAVTCPETTNKFLYRPGKTYEYEFESDITTTIVGTSSEKSSLHMRAVAQLEAMSTCEMVLRLSEVSLRDSNPLHADIQGNVPNLNEFITVLQEKPMAFVFVDGRIDSVCPRADDETWAVNIRRGILSTLQNTMTSLKGVATGREIDVAGNCPVVYEVVSGSSSWEHTIKVQKNKDLLGCTDRQDVQTIFQGSHYDSSSNFQSLPLIKSTYKCEQDIDSRSRLLSKSSCVENHSFRPFTKIQSGASTEVTYKLMLRREIDGTRTADGSQKVRSSLLFDHTLSADRMLASIRDIEQTVTGMCQLSQVDVRPQLPALFTKLVRQMRALDARALNQLYTSATSAPCEKARQFYRDALPLIGTTASVSVMRSLIASQQATNKEIDVWLTSLAFIKNPTRDMMRELKLVMIDDMARAALSVSAVVNTYCRQYEGLESSGEVTQIIRQLESQLRYNCRSESDEQTSHMLTALRALGNAGLAASQSTPTLERCARNNDIPTAVRVAAINAFRRFQCTDSIKESMLALLESRDLDSEVRINAYLAAMRCADDQTLLRVQSILESEEINQVGSFIWTHLTNLQETASPAKMSIRAILENIQLQKQFDLDKRKFSRNIELSTFSELLNVGASVESNLIWSSDSFVPRSAMLNLTVDVFGQSVNLLEVGGRVQGLEDLLEKVFGPESNSIRSREKRALVHDNLLNSIDRKFAKTIDNDQLSYYVRVFGNDIRAGDFYQFNIDAIKSQFNFLDWMIELSREHEIDVIKNWQFLDTSLTIPTGTGLPLRLMAEGTSSIGLTANGKADIRQMFSSPSTFDIRGSVRPSAAVEITGEMGVDAHVAKTGLKIINMLHTSTVIDGVLQLKDGKVFDLDFNLPQDKTEIFTAESHVYVTYRGDYREQTVPASESWQWNRCTSPVIAEKTGLELCAELSLPNKDMSLVPPRGAAVARVYLNKRDTYTGVHFDASYIQTESNGTDVVRVSFNTPGSRVDRELTTEFHLDRQQRQVQLNVKTPWKKVNVRGSLVNGAALKKAMLTAILDETTEYSVNAELQVAANRRQTRYTPKVEVVIPGRVNILFDGTVIYTRGSQAQINVALKNAFRDPVTARGLMRVRERRTSTKYNVALQIGSPIFRGSLTGFTNNVRDRRGGSSWASRADLSYQYDGGRKERVVVNHKIRDQSTNNLNTYSMDSSWTSTMWPSYNGETSFEISFSPNSLRTKIEAGLDSVRKVEIFVTSAYDITGREKKINGLVKFTVPYKDWNYEVKLDHINSGNRLQSNATVKYGSIRQQSVASLDLGLKRQSRRPLNVVGDAKLIYEGREWTLTEQLTEPAPREYSSLLRVRLPTGTLANVVSSYKMSPRHEFTNDITVTNMRPIRINGHLKPVLKNMQARVDIGYQGKSYLVDASWMHRGIARAFNTNVSAELSIAGHTAGLSAELSRRNEQFTASIETKYNQDKRIALSSQVTASMLTPRFLVRVDWPRNFFAVAGSGKYEHRDWYVTNSDLEGSIQITSSLPGFEELGASFLHDLNVNSFKTTGEVIWATNRKIDAVLTVDQAKASLTLNTPFRGYQSIKVESTYNIRGVSGTVSSRVQWDGRQMSLVLQGDANQPSRMVTGRVQFSSPFSGFESLSTNFQYRVSGATRRTNADFSWARDKQVSVVITMTHERSGWSITNNGEMTVRTPFDGYRISKWSWSHENSADKWKCHHELDVRSRQFIVDIDASHRVTRALQRLSAKIAFETPANIASWLQNLNVTIDYQHDMHAWKTSGRTNLQWGRYAFGHEHDVDIEPYRALVITAKVTTPFIGFEQVGIGLNNRRTGNLWRANNEILLGSTGKVTLDGAFNYSDYNFDSMIRMTTPIRHLERIVVNVRNAQQRDNVWASHADVQYASHKTISVNSKLSLGSQKMIELEAATPCPFFRQMKYKAGYFGTWRSFQAHTELQHNRLGREKITAMISVDANNLHRMNGQLVINTPFEEFSSLRLTARHIQDSYENVTTTVSWQLNQYQGSLFMEFALRDDSLHTVFRFTTPFTAIDRFAFEANLSGRPRLFSLQSVVEFNNQKLTKTLEFQLHQKTLRMNGNLETPFRHFRSLTYVINHNGDWRNFRNNFIVTYNGQEITGSSEFNVDRSSINFELHTPWRALRSYNFQHVNKPGSSFVGWRTSWSVESNGQRQSGRSECDWNGNQLDAHIVWHIPQEYSIRISHTGNSVNHFSNNVVIKLAGDRITEALEFTRTTDMIHLQLNMTSSFRGYERMEAMFKHELSDRGFTTTANISTPFRIFPRMSTGLTYQHSENQLSSQLRAQLPFDAIQRLVVSLNHRGNPSDFSSSLTTTVNDKTITSMLRFNNRPRSMEGSLSIHTPFSGYDRFHASIGFNGEPQRFTATSTVQLPFDGYERFFVELSHSGNWRSFQTSGKVESSRASLQTVNFNVEHTATSWTQIKTLASVVVPSGNFSAKLIHSGDVSNFRTNLEVRTPLSGYSSFAVSIEHEHLDSLKTSVSMQTPIQGYENFGLSLLKTGDIRNLQLKAELMTSIRQLERTVVNWSHNVNIPAIELHGMLETSFSHYQRMALTFSHSVARRSVRTNILVETSIPGYSKFSTSSEYSSSRRNWKWIGSVEMPIRDYGRWTAGIEHAKRDNSDGFRTVVQMTTPVNNYNNFAATMSHSGEASQFRTQLRVNLPFRKVPQIDVTLTHRGASPKDFTTSLSIDYAGKRIELEMAFKMGLAQQTEINYEGSFRLVAPCPYVRDFSIRMSHNCKPEIKAGALKIIFNGDEKVDLDYSYTMSGDNNININVRSPYTVATELSMAGSGQGSAVINWDPTTNYQQIRFDFGLKNIETSSMTDCALNFKTAVLRRTVGFSVGYKVTSDRLTSHGELLWDTDSQPDFVYDFDARRTSVRGHLAYDGSLKVSSYLFNTESSFSHRIVAERHFVTEVIFDLSEKLTVRSDLNLEASTAITHQISLQHPRLSRDITLATEATREGFKTTLSYERQIWILEGTLKDESRHRHVKYSGLVRLSSPTNSIDVQLMSNAASDAETTSGGIGLKYLTNRDRQLKTLALKAEINRLRKELKLELETPIDVFKLSTRNRQLQLHNGVVSYEVLAESDRFNLRSSVDFSHTDRSLDLKFYSTPESYVELFGQYVSPTKMTFELSRTHNGNHMNDAQLSMSFDDDERLLRGRAYMRPTLWNDIKAKMRPENFASFQLSPEVAQLRRSLEYDVRLKSHYLRQSVAEPLLAVIGYYRSEVSRKWHQLNYSFDRMYRENEFYMRDIHQTLKRHYDDFRWRMQNKLAELRQTYYVWSAKMQQNMNTIRVKLQRWSDDVSQRHLCHLSDFFDAAKMTLMDWFDEILTHPYIRDIIEKVTTMDISYQLLSPSEWRDKLLSYMDMVDNKIRQMMQQPQFVSARNWLHITIQNNKWMYQPLGMERHVNEWLAHLNSLTWDTVKAKAKQYLQLAKTRWTVWDPRRGEYAFQVYIPFNLPDMSFVRRFDPRPFVKQWKDWLAAQLPDENWSLLDIIYTYKPSSDVNNWIPPFKSHASLTGAQHFMTFDRRFFEFAGDCSYLLMRDFVSGTFSVIVNYDRAVRGRPVKKSLTVISGGQQLEVFPDGKVTVDGSRVEMPVKISNTTVTRTGHMIRVADEWRGVGVTCDLPHDHCSLTISGWYYGKTAGLLGTYDNEPANDMTTSDNTLASNVETLADSWTVGRRCRPVSRAVIAGHDTDSPRYEACTQLFNNETSLFRTCYRIVNPAPFLTMCLNDDAESTETDVCRVAASYVHECRRLEVHIRMPKHCVRCEVPDTGKLFYEMETVQLDKPTDLPRAADVVFIIQQAPCNLNLMNKISAVVDGLDKAMRTQGLTSLRYAVVGFGGKQLHLANPYVHTMDGQVFNSANKVTLTLDKFDLEPGTDVDVMQAVRYAAQLPFRAGASKTMILMACSECTEMKQRYSDVQRLLVNNDIHLHVLVHQILRLKSRSPKTAYIYGVDTTTVYTRKDVAGEELEGEPDLLGYVRLPKDLCVALTHETNGSVFSARQWLDSRPLTQKQFVDVMVRSIARKAIPTECQLCQCIADDAQVGVSQCRSCHRRLSFILNPAMYDNDDGEVENMADDDVNDDISSPSNNSNDRRHTRRPRIRRPSNRRNNRRLTGVTRRPGIPPQ